MKLTKRAIDALLLREKDYMQWDDELSGFGVRVWPSGAKVYQVRYRQNGRQRFFKLGKHGAVTVEEARKAAKGILGDIARGEDPQEEKVTRRKSMTVAELCDEYLRAADRDLIPGKGGGPKKPTTLANDRGRIERHIKPLLGRKLVTDLSRQDISGFIRDVHEGKTAVDRLSGNKRRRVIVTGGRGTAARTKGLLGGILSYAVDRGIIESNPATGVKTPPSRVRHRRFSDEELRALGQALREADDQVWQSVVFCKLVCLTGWRKGEIQSLRWDSLDLSRSTARLEDTKEGRSLRPIGAPVVKLLESLERKSSYVLPPVRMRHGEHYNGGHAAFKRLCGRAGMKDVSAHIARHTVVTKGQEELGYSESLCGAVVGHRRSDTVTGRYTHFASAILVQVATSVSSEMAKIMGFENLL